MRNVHLNITRTTLLVKCGKKWASLVETETPFQCLVDRVVKAVFMLILDHGDTLKPLDFGYHSALRLITCNSYYSHHCIPLEKVGRFSLS